MVNSRTPAAGGRPDLHIADLASESVIVFDPAGMIIYWNPASEALYGWPPVAMIGHGIDQVSERPADERTHWPQVLKEGVWQGRVRRRHISGCTIIADVRQYARFLADGSPQEVIEFGRRSPSQDEPDVDDWIIPDRLNAAAWEIDIAGAREQIGAVAALGDAGTPSPEQMLIDVVSAARIVDVNDRTVRLVGGNRGRSVMIGQSVSKFWPIWARATLGELITETAAADVPGKAFQRQLASDGILRDPVLTLWIGETPDRMFIAVNGTADDDRSYLYLGASEARYRKLVQYMPTALLQVDASHMGKIYAEIKSSGVEDFGAYLDEHPELLDHADATVVVTDVNRRAVELFAGESAVDLTRPVAYLFAANRNTLKNVMVGRFKGQASHSELTKIRTFDGRILDVQMSVTYPIPPGELDVTIFNLQDVTAQLRIETQFRQLQADFSHAARISTLCELTTSIAHEINQPLAAILTNAETSLRWLARAEPDVEKVRQLTTRVAAGAQRANAIVQRIRGMAAKQEPERAALDINEVAQEAMLFLRHEIESRSVGIATVLAKGLPSLNGDRIQLQQVIVNLLLNGIQAMGAHQTIEPTIMLTTGIEGDNLLSLSIRDTGPGIPTTDIDRIFEGFFTTKPGGLGIGLGICRSIISAHGGSLSATNHPAGGAEFRFTLPSGPRAGTA